MNLIDATILLLIALSCIPLVILCVEINRHYGKKAAAITLFAFILFCIGGMYFLETFRLLIVLIFPILFFAILFIKNRKKPDIKTLDSEKSSQ
jgi:hypothetical protein